MQVNCGIFHHSFSYLRVLEHWLYIYYNAIRRAKHFDDLHRVITKLVAGALTLNQFIHIKKLSDKKKKGGVLPSLVEVKAFVTISKPLRYYYTSNREKYKKYTIYLITDQLDSSKLKSSVKPVTIIKCLPFHSTITA